MFIVTGDHGMRADGNHGGTSIEEVETFVFGYYKGGDLFRSSPKAIVAHSDITTTLALLLGIPLPNNAIGYPILNMIPASMLSETSLHEINQHLFEHFSSMLQFYNMPLPAEESQ
jgi:arylsulfatase A-like enzyme